MPSVEDDYQEGISLSYLAAGLHVLGSRARERFEWTVQDDPERGSETIEKVLWAVAVIAIVGIVVTVIRAYVTTESANIK